MPEIGKMGRRKKEEICHVHDVPRAQTDGERDTNRTKEPGHTCENGHRNGLAGKPSKHTTHANSDSTDYKWWMLLIGVSVMSICTRFHKVASPDHICWDETHFGKMGSWYINRTFFFDVHPPLGKMLIGLAGHMTGYNGSFPFGKPGDKYGDTPYLGMRLFCASLGACIVPLCFAISWELSRSHGAALLTAVIVTFDTGILTLSQYILLDPILLFFIMASTYSLVKFQSLSTRPFSPVWWLWLTSTGLFLACSIGVKFVGLFVILLAGYTMAWDLWRMLGELKLPLNTWFRHFLARAVCLIGLPTLVYMAIFQIHFSVLSKSGSGDGFFSSAFQSQLEGNALYKASMPQYVAYGSIVTIKNHRTAGAYLHSHWHLYPEGIGARQQQVTSYSHKDVNNRWLVKEAQPSGKDDSNIRFVENGHIIRLEHVQTRRNLHSHREMAPLSKQHYQVTCYGENGTGDSNDFFRIDIPGTPLGEPLSSVRSVFRLIHHSTGCAVQSHNKELPKWGWNQLEVSCNPSTRDKQNRWNVEEISDSRLPNSSFEVYAPSFWEKFIESHALMTQGNKGLKPKEGEVTSRPWHWPVNFKGQPFSGGDYRVYLLGNPVIWWSNLLVLCVFCLYAVYSLTKHQVYRGSGPQIFYRVPRVVCGCGWLLLGWALHYLPFWSMTRVLYFHHYFPSFLYNCMLSGIFAEYTIKELTQLLPAPHSWVVYHCVLGTTISSLGYSFVIFNPLSYGMHGPGAQDPQSLYAPLKWLSSWDF